MRTRLALATVLLVLAGAVSAAPPLPEAVVRDFPGMKAQGEGRLRYFGIHVYDASLWTPAAWSAQERFVLDIRYAIAIRGKALTERSLKEMRGQGFTDEAKLARWSAEMDRVFPDLQPGDRLVGAFVPGKEARFYNDKGPLGVVADAEFARAFFAIWMDEKTSQPGLRLKLLGRDPP